MKAADLDAVTLDAHGTLVTLTDPVPALTSVLLAVAFRRAGGRVATRNERIAGTARTLFAFSWVLTVWTVAMLIVQGLDTTLVGWFDFKRVGAYGFAAGVVTLIALSGPEYPNSGASPHGIPNHPRAF